MGFLLENFPSMSKMFVQEHTESLKRVNFIHTLEQDSANRLYFARIFLEYKNTDYIFRDIWFN